ncbi:MAG TPA: hypothetical protein V6C52_04795 [Coleofasciculaceae cyanobacterium]|jgi:hypothetical protein
MPTNIPIMPILFILLLLLPMRLSGIQMKGLAFFLWFLGGLILAFRGVNFLFAEPAHPAATLMVVIVLVSLIIGWGKGQFVLSKTSRRNIERIDAFTQPMRPIYVYGTRSWIIIGLMVLISVALNILNVALLWRGAVNLAIGAALLISSLAYLKALVPPEPPSIPSDGHNIGPGVGP